MVLPFTLAKKYAFQYWPLNNVSCLHCVVRVIWSYISLQTPQYRYIIDDIGKIDDNKQIAVHYTNKAIFLLNFTINIILQPKPGSQEMHDNTNTC